ncbi:MAG: hypothetical protein LBJ02_00950 [Bifidobacteriaceae bacterium]|jgi:hypothetical protein|nr:hypothetical protein [Bifidobacteriaceae bacterium]
MSSNRTRRLPDSGPRPFRFTSRIIATTVAGAALIAGIAVPAQAKGDATPKADKDARQIVDLVAEVAPGQEDVVAGKLTGKAIETSAEGVVVDVPLDPAKPIELAAKDAKQTGSLAIGLPDEVTAEKAVVAPDGSVVYEASDKGASVVVQTLDNGSVRLQTVSPDANSAKEFSYSFGAGVTPVIQKDGSVRLVEKKKGVDTTVGTVAPAWAFDANGASVPTHYEVVGSDLVQVIEPSANAAYPIVADPCCLLGWILPSLYSAWSYSYSYSYYYPSYSYSYPSYSYSYSYPSCSYSYSYSYSYPSCRSSCGSPSRGC